VDDGEDKATYTETAEDDSNVLLDMVLTHISSGEAGKGWSMQDGGLESIKTVAEGPNYDSDQVVLYKELVAVEADEGGQGKRRRRLTAKALAMLS
jgi:hypothetical protein